MVLGASGGAAALHLERNNLTVLDASKLINLGGSTATQVHIFLSNNAITQVTNGPITLNAGTSLLDFSNNAFTSFDGGWVSINASSTGNLTLSHNQISTITNPPVKSSLTGNGELVFNHI